MAGWPGYEAAVKRDRKGVAKVLRVADLVPAHEGRVAQNPSLVAELAWIIEIESKWEPWARNPDTQATGLIQFMPDTAKTLGTTVDALKGMTLSEQAPYILDYFKRIMGQAGKATIPGDLYMMTFYPKYLNNDDDDIIADKNGPYPKVWEQNPGLRCTPEGPITVGCVRSKGIPKSLPSTPFPSVDDPPKGGGGNDGGQGGKKKSMVGPVVLAGLGLGLVVAVAKRLG